METAPSLIKSFSIYGLFGTHDVHIPFNESIKILIGENGLGKTQVLNMFYYTLCGRFERLIDFSFDKVELAFSDDDAVSITKDEIEQSFPRKSDVIYVIDKIREEVFIQAKHPSNLQHRFSLDDWIRVLKLNKDTLSDNLQQCREKIAEKLDQCNIIYFPTYRRVEEDLKILGYDEEQFHQEDNRLIHFGMDDVLSRFNEMESTIDKLLKEGFSKISGDILSQLVKGFTNTDTTILNRIDQNDIDIILARVGEQLSEADKNEIREIVVSQEIKNDSLSYFLQKLIEIYEKQKPLDNFIKVYRDVCNKYLINKKVFYDESAIRIFVKSDISDEEIELSQLSSGEKQIISIFSKIYLAEEEKNFIVLFDEPELSLSIFWQRQLLPDIIKSGKCSFLLAVTHSPFIFENELEQYAIGLNEFVQPIQSITHP
ncbi:MAG: AAA family ATPase [Microcystaceae cyanobacterium]